MPRARPDAITNPASPRSRARRSANLMAAAEALRAPTIATIGRASTGSLPRAAIIGGVAASLRGTPRFTRDIDAVVLEADAETLLRSATGFDLVPRIPDAIEFAHETRVLLLRHAPTGIDIDLSLGALPFEEELVDRSTLIDIGSLRVRVAASEDLVIMKAVAGRARQALR